MTITPTPLVPAPAAGTTSAAADGGQDQAAAAGFGDLLAQLAAAALADGKPVALGAAAGVSSDEVVTAEPVAEGAGEGDGTASAETLRLLTEGRVAAVGAPTTMPTGNVQQVAGGAGDASLAETAVKGVTRATTPAHPGTDQSHAAAVLTGTSLPAGEIAGPHPSTEPAFAPTATTSAAAEPQAGPQQTNHQPGTPLNAAAPASAPASAAASAAVASGAGAATAAPGATASPLLDQVTPVVSRMVSAGEGSHRMVLRLHPADLGEVQLTVTVRGESVDVTVAAGTEARELLAGGSHELRSLLDSIGRTAGQVTFKDLPGGAQLQQASPSGLGTGGQPDTGQPGTSFGDVPGGRGGERDGRGGPDGSGRTGTDGPEGHGREPAASRGTRTSGAPGDGALDVRI